jgi:NitT/TauT family transport system ATP-binding protein
LTREQAQDLFLSLWMEKRTTTLFVTHSIEEAAAMGRRILILSHGPGTALEIVDNPRSGMENYRMSAEFHALADHIRAAVCKSWKTDRPAHPGNGG